MLAKTTRPPTKVLLTGAHQLLLDNLRVVLGTMGCLCFVASSLKEAQAFLEKEKPEAVILDPQLPDSSPVEVLAALQTIALRLQGRVVVLTREQDDSQLLDVVEAYSLPKVPVDTLLQQLWPCLDSLLRRTARRRVKHGARLVFDSFLQPLADGVRSAQIPDHRLLYESGDVMVDLSLEPGRDTQRVRLIGQILDPAKPGPQLRSAPVVLQGQTEPIETSTTNELGEFQFDFDPRPDLRLEIGVRENHWLSIDLPDPEGASTK
jgi:DNA-binding response OmpR family regulator